MNSIVWRLLLKLSFLFLIGTGVWYLFYIAYRKPQTVMQQTEDVPIEVRSIATGNMLALWGPDHFMDPQLRFLQAMELMSTHALFGGWSALSVSDNESRLTAISDTGHWLEANILKSAGLISGLTSARIGPLLNENGMALRSSGYGDIEAITMNNKHVFLGHESFKSGVWSGIRKDSLENTRFKRWPPLAGIVELPKGRGLEALTIVEDTTHQITQLLAIAERDNSGTYPRTQAWFINQAAQIMANFFIDLADGYEVSDAAFNSRCGLFVLQRKLNILGRFFVRLTKLDMSQNLLSGPVKQQILFEANSQGMAIDNMEALAVVAKPSGGCHVYMLSDSNYLPIQKTIMLKFGYH